MGSYKERLLKGAAVMAAFALIAPVASAATLGGDTNVKFDGGPLKVESQTGVSVDIDLDSDSDDSDNNNKEGIRMENGVNVAGDARKSGNDKSDNEIEEEKEHGIENAKSHASDEGLGGLENAELHIDLSGDDEEDADEASTTAEIDEAADVHSSHDFEHFAAHKAKGDDRLRGVEVKDGKVKVDYDEDAKLFGFMKTRVTARATADTNGNVTVEYPWYHIFMKKDRSSASLQSDIARAIAALKKGEQEGVASTTVEAAVSAAFSIPNLFELIADTLAKRGGGE